MCSCFVHFDVFPFVQSLTDRVGVERVVTGVTETPRCRRERTTGTSPGAPSYPRVQPMHLAYVLQSGNGSWYSICELRKHNRASMASPCSLPADGCRRPLVRSALHPSLVSNAGNVGLCVAELTHVWDALQQVALLKDAGRTAAGRASVEHLHQLMMMSGPTLKPSQRSADCSSARVT